MTQRDFLEEFCSTSLWGKIPTKHRFQYCKDSNAGMKEKHRLALTMNGVIDRALDDAQGLQSLDYSVYQIFEKGDLVFKLIDLQNIRTSRVGLVPRRGIMSPAYIRLIPKNDEVLSDFYYWYFYAAYLGNIFNGLGGGIRQNLSQTELLEFPVPDIPVEDQASISSFLYRETARVDELIAKKKLFIKLLDEKRAATISHVVTKGLNEDADSQETAINWIGNIPASWTLTKLGYLGRCANGINIGGDSFGTGYPFVSYGDVYNNRELPTNIDGLVQSTKADRIAYSVKSGDVLFTRTSETIDEIAFPSVCTETIQNAVFAGFLIRFRPFADVLVPRFSKFAFQNKGLRAFFVKEMKLVTRASLSQGLLRNMPVALPPIKQQEEIAEYLEEADAKFKTLITKTVRSIDLLKEKRTALITAAVTGKIDVRSMA